MGCERGPGRGSPCGMGCERGPGRGSLRPPAPVRCSARASLRTHFRGDPPRRAGRRLRLGRRTTAGSHATTSPPAALSRCSRHDFANTCVVTLLTPRLRHQVPCHGAHATNSPPGALARCPTRRDPSTRSWGRVRGATERNDAWSKVVRPESDGRSHVSRAASTSRGVAPEVSAQRGTSGATNGGGGPQAPPTRTSFVSRTTWAPPIRTSLQIRKLLMGFIQLSPAPAPVPPFALLRRRWR
jgi:hypothetical protein